MSCTATVSRNSKTKGQQVDDHVNEISAAQLRHLAYRMSNIDKAELVDAGIIKNHVGGNDWRRFNEDPMVFIIKLDDEKLARLAEIIGTD